MVAVVGPTGIGKTRVAFELALSLGGEIVVADSRQVFRQLDIATNKPDPIMRAMVRYHLVDVVDPGEPFNVHDYVTRAGPAIEEIAARGRLPIVEGGSSLYLDALLDGFNLAGVAPRPERRRELQRLSTEQLVELLNQLDPGAEVDRRNPVRLVRAIEVLEVAGPPLGRLRQRQQPSWDAVRVGITAPRDVIARRLAERSNLQVDRGLLEETRVALAAGVRTDVGVLTGIGYAEAIAHIRGRLGREDLPARMAQSNRRYARRQLSWLRRDPRILWFDAEPDPLPAILRFLNTELGLPS